MSAAVNGRGRLRSVIEAARVEAGLSLADLTVLEKKRDPYRFDTVAGHRNAEWFAAQVARFVPRGATIHLRGLHYRCVACGDVIKPHDGRIYINTDKCWEWLADEAAKAARWLGYVPFHRIVDERNAEPELYEREEYGGGAVGWCIACSGAAIELATALHLHPRVSTYGFRATRQPYRLILIGEKVSLGSELRGVAQAIGAELLLPTGELSDTLIHGIASRANEDGRPAVVLYFSDFDPAGRQMPISIARKLQALRDLEFPELQIEVHPVALTLDQVVGFDLPSTPLKPTEQRADRWREVMGREQTEIDALLALHPGAIEQLASEAARPFYDRTLYKRVRDARERLLRDADSVLQAHPAHATACQEIDTAHAAVEEALAALHDAQERAQSSLQSALKDLPKLRELLPQPKVGLAPPTPLFTTDSGYIRATLRLNEHRSLAGDAP